MKSILIRTLSVLAAAATSFAAAAAETIKVGVLHSSAAPWPSAKRP